MKHVINLLLLIIFTNVGVAQPGILDNSFGNEGIVTGEGYRSYIFATALQKDGWFITHDPFIIPAGKKEIQIDLGAERLVAAQKGKELIAVEIKSFKSTSHIYEFYRAIGQFEFYAFTLEPVEPERLLFLAVPEGVYESFFQDPHII